MDGEGACLAGIHALSGDGVAASRGFSGLSGINPNQWRSASVAAENGVGRIVPIDRQPNKADCGEMPITMTVFRNGNVAISTAVAASQRINRCGVLRHAGNPESRGSVQGRQAVWFDTDQIAESELEPSWIGFS